MRKLLFLCMALLATTTLWAYDFQSGDLYYNITSSSEPYAVEVNDAKSSITTVIIPETVTYKGQTYSVTSIGDHAFGDCYSLTSITIPNSVTSIRDEAFYFCFSLTSVTIPNSVTSIGEGAFYECSSLTSVTIPNSAMSIEDYAFSHCSSLTSITIPNSVTSIGDYAFEYCRSLTSITIPNSVTSIGSYAFYACSSLTSITIPESVMSIEDHAFSYCSFLTSVTIPNSVTSIGYRAFEACSSLTSITIPNSVTSIGSGAFYDCQSLSIITVPEGTIGQSAFRRCISLTSVIIGNGVTSIGDYAFLDCAFLSSITIGNSVCSIGTIPFDVRRVVSIVVEDGNTTYDSRDNCNAIIETATNTLVVGCQTTKIPDNITSIGDYAFDNCSSLTSVTIPNSVTSIGDEAFSLCFSLDTVCVKAITPPSLGSDVFYSTPASICYIPCGTLAAYQASDWAQYVGEFVEECNKCGNRLYWQFDDTQLSITGQGEMYDYDLEPQPWQQYRNKMQTISLPEGITSIGASAFAECKYVKSVTIPSTVEKIHDSAFEDCRMLSSLSFAEPSTLTSIGNWAFYNCHKLQYITIPEGVTEIGEAAFFDCTYLSELTLPATMEYIADNGFGLCAKLKRINVSATTPPAVEARTFENVDRSIPVYVPDAAVNDYKAAPVWQEFNIVGKSGVPAALDNIPAENSATRKLLRDGNLVIIRDGVEYNVMGQQL